MISMRFEVIRKNDLRKLLSCDTRREAKEFYNKYRHNFKLVVLRITYDCNTGMIFKKVAIPSVAI